MELYSDTVEALRSAVRLKERFTRLEARVAALEEGKVDRTQLGPLRDAISNRGEHNPSLLFTQMTARPIAAHRAALTSESKRLDLSLDS